MRTYTLFISLLTLTFIQGVRGQDPHFSQFRMTPLYLDPSNAGSFNGDQRVIMNYRDQWRSVANPYQTFDLSFDMMAIDGGKESGSLGIGVLLYRDVAGDLNYGTTKGDLLVSYHLPVSDNHIVQAGISGGYVQESIDRDKMKWGSQYTLGGYDPSIDPGEGVAFEPISYPDVSAGVSWSYTTGGHSVVSNEGKAATAGFALHHTFAPSRTFYSDGDTDPLKRKYVGYAKGSIGIGEGVGLRPGGMVSFKGPQSEVLVGTLISYRLKSQSKYTGLISGAVASAGAHLRVGDALVVNGLIEMGSFALGMSYDINLSDLTVASQGQGGFEFSLRFINPNPFKEEQTGVRFM